MVDKSTRPFQTHFGPVFGDEAVQRGLLFPWRGSIRVLLWVLSPLSPRHDPVLVTGFGALKRKAKARGKRGLRAPSIVGWFCRLPELLSAAESVAPDVCPLVREAAQASPAAIRAVAQNDSKLATTRDEPGAVRPVGK
jgi:hypothetical protein